MIYQGVHIYFCNLWFGQGLVINSKRVIVKLVKDATGEYVHLDTTCDVIQHELQHCKDIKRKGWLDFMLTTLWQYIFKKHDNAAYEPDAEVAELLDNQLIKIELINYCFQHNLKFY